MKFEKHYSGKNSERIWKIINHLPESRRNELYSVFVLLQNMEGTCLTWLENALFMEKKSTPQRKDER